jgi:hypothetical protein
MSVPLVSTFRAHLKSPGDGQFLKDHRFNVSAITSRLAAKIGMPRAGALVDLVNTAPVQRCFHLRFR